METHIELAKEAKEAKMNNKNMRWKILNSALLSQTCFDYMSSSSCKNKLKDHLITEAEAVRF